MSCTFERPHEHVCRASRLSLSTDGANAPLVIFWSGVIKGLILIFYIKSIANFVIDVTLVFSDVPIK